MASLTYLRILAYLTLLSSGHLFLKRMPSALQGVSAQHVSSWLRCFPTASSVTGRILEVLRYVPIPALRARIRRSRQPTYAKRASHASSTLIPSEAQVQVDVSRTGRVTPIPSPVINMTLPGNSESYSDRLRERLYSPSKTPPRHRGYPSVA